MWSDEDNGDLMSDNEEEEPSTGTSSKKKEETENGKPVKGIKYLKQMKEILGLDEYKDKCDRKREKRQRQKARRKEIKKRKEENVIIETLATKANPCRRPPPEVHVFQDPQKKYLNKPNGQSDNKNSDRHHPAPKNFSEERKSGKSEDVTMKQARFDVFKFGWSGFDKSRKEDEEIAHAIRLGAKPAKKKGLPYKEYKEKLKQEKADKAEKHEQDRISGMLKLNKPQKSLSGKNKSVGKGGGGGGGGGGATGKKRKAGGSDSIQTKMGKFDGGMLKLTAADIKRINSKK